RWLPAGRVAEAVADVADAEVHQVPVIVPEGVRHQDRLKQAIQEAERPRGPVVRGQVTVRKPGPEGLHAHVRERADLAAHRGGNLTGLRPADLQRAEYHPGAAQREHRTSPGRPAAHQGDAVLPGRTPGRPPELKAVPRRPLGERAHVRVYAPPAAGVA